MILLTIERFFHKTPKQILKMPISTYKIYSDQALNHLAASMGNKFEPELNAEKKNRLRERLKKLKEEAETRKQNG